MPAVLDEHDQLTDCVAEVTPMIDSPVNRDDLLSRLQTVYEELDSELLLCITTLFRPPSATVVSAEPFSHGTGTLRCLQKEMATYRH